MSPRTGDEPAGEEQTTSDEPSGEEQTTSDEPAGEEQTIEEESGVPTSKQRRATAKRKLERQLERRAKQARRRQILIIAALAGVVVVVAGLVLWAVVFKKDSDETSTASTSTSSLPPTPTTSPPAQAGVLPPFTPPAGLGENCTYPATPDEPAAKPVTPPRSGKVPTDPAMVSVSMTTNQGPLGIQLDNGKAPCTVNNFVSLGEKGFFNDTHCHRLTADEGLSVLQCGDPKGDGLGGPGYKFANEYPTSQYQPNDPALSQPVIYPRGTLAMANSGLDTNGSQFFIVYKDSQLQPLYTVFGTVDQKDMAVLDKIAAAGTVDGSPEGKPKTDVVITSVRQD